MDDARQLKKEKIEKSLRRRTKLLMVVFGVLAFAVLAVQLYSVQVKGHDYYAAKAISQQTMSSAIFSSRGTIYDVNGKILAMSTTVENVFLSPYEIEKYSEDKNLIADGLSPILGISRDDIISAMSDTNSQYKVLKKKVDVGVADEIRAFKKANGIIGLHTENDSKRNYPYDYLASQVVGFVGDENIGLEGLEAQYNDFLTGTDGRVVSLRNNNGAGAYFENFENTVSAQNGDDITLTIDTNVQYYVERNLKQAIETYSIQKGGACIVMRPKTGEILAMASFGNFDPNNFMKLSDKETERLALITDEEDYKKEYSAALYGQWRNKALSDTYEPGSVFKIITLAIALEEGLVSEDSTFFCGGNIEVPGRIDKETKKPLPLHCWNLNGHGEQTLTEVMKNSCNIAIAEMAMSIGQEKFYKYIDAFGLFGKTGFDLPGESNSLWWPEAVFFEKGQLSQLASASFGQTFNITPLQMITAVSAAVNGGYLMQPHVVKQISDQDGEIVRAENKLPLRQVVSGATSAKVREILEKVVSDGAGKNAYVKGYRVGGKTGTSEKIVQNAIDEDAPKQYIVSFCGVAPMNDPQVAVLLMLDEPSNETGLNRSGGDMAAPIVGNILSEILPYLGVTPQYTDAELEALNVTVPKLAEKSRDEAIAILRKLGLTFNVQGDGTDITGQIPAPNSVIVPNSPVLLYAGTEVPTGDRMVPNVAGKSFEGAKKAMEEAGLYIRSIGAQSTIQGAVVSVQSIEPGIFVPIGSIIEVTLIDKTIQGNY